jgi:hypothetical protein
MAAFPQTPSASEMNASSLPSYATLVLVAIVLVNLATAWVVMLTMGENSGQLFAGAPPGIAALSCLLLILFYYNAMLPIEVSFWGSAFLAVMGLWGAWADYRHLAGCGSIPCS